MLRATRDKSKQFRPKLERKVRAKETKKRKVRAKETKKRKVRSDKGQHKKNYTLPFKMNPLFK